MTLYQKLQESLNNFHLLIKMMSKYEEKLTLSKWEGNHLISSKNIHINPPPLWMGGLWLPHQTLMKTLFHFKLNYALF